MLSKKYKSIISILTGSSASQGLNAIAGILLVHQLAVIDYAYYTIAISSISTLAILSTSGANLAFSHLLAKYWQMQGQVAFAYHLIIRKRTYLALLSAPPILAITAWQLWRSDPNYTMIAFVLGAIAVTSIVEVIGRQREQILHFAGKAALLAYYDAVLALLRLGTIGLLVTNNTIDAGKAMVLGTTISLARYIYLVKRTRSYLRQPPDNFDIRISNQDKANTNSIIMRQLPVEVFGCLQPQLILILAAVYSTGTQTAEIGALGRFAILLSPLQSLVNAYYIPQYIRDTKKTVTMYFQIIGITSFPAILLVAAAYIAPSSLLLIVGNNYSHLHEAVRLSAGAAALSMIGGTAWGLLAHRGWNHWSWLQIPVNLAWIAATFAMFPVGNLQFLLILQYGPGVALIVSALADLIAGNRRRFSQDYA